MNLIIKVSTALAILITTMGYAELQQSGASLYLDEDAQVREKHYPHNVKFFFQNSRHPCVRLGTIRTTGNAYANFDNLIEKAKQKAAEIGADFIVLIGKGGEEGQDSFGAFYKPWANFSVWVYKNNQKEAP